MAPLPVLYFSDVLCIWAYLAEPRLDAIEHQFGDRVRIDYRFCSVFGDTASKIPATWGKAGGYSAFNAHLRQSAEAFPEVALNPEIWMSVRPASSWSAHLFLKAVQLDEVAGGCAVGTARAAIRSVRGAFFRDARDIGRWDVQSDVGARTGVDIIRVESLIRDGQAIAALASDYQDADSMRVQGSPSFVLNEGRQKLYGNVGFRIIEANIEELLRTPEAGQASWC
jgi:predicted DsbA family dithiol-disulfide isomerase